MKTLEEELEEIGFTSREAVTYVAVLELGPSPVQNIARRAKIVRSTTYLVLESLEKQGMVEKCGGKKTLFQAVAPSQLVYSLLEEERESLLRKIQVLDLVPRLQALHNDDSEKPVFRLFSGEEGLHKMRQLMVMYSKSGDVWRIIINEDAVRKELGNDFLPMSYQSAKNIQVKRIFTTRDKKLRNSLSKHSKIEGRFIEPERYSSPASLFFVRNRVALIIFTNGKSHGVIIEDASIAVMATQLFEMLWKCLQGQARDQ